MSTAMEIGNKIKDSWTKELDFSDHQGSAVISVNNYFGAGVKLINDKTAIISLAKAVYCLSVCNF